MKQLKSIDSLEFNITKNFMHEKDPVYLYFWPNNNRMI